MAQPGWYDDPENPGRQRWWDGSKWLDKRRAQSWWRRPSSIVLLVVVALMAVSSALSALESFVTSNEDRTARPSRQEQYITWMRERVPGAADKSDSELVNGGRQLCRSLDDVDSVDELAFSMTVLELDPDEFAAAVVGAVNAFCPRHRDLIESGS